MYPSLEVTKSSILRHVILPSGVRLLTWHAGVESDTHTRVGYALYRSGYKTPILQGHYEFGTQHITEDSMLMELLGLVVLSAWDPRMYVHDIESYATEYTEEQIDWLNSTEVEGLCALLNLFEAQLLDELDSEVLPFEWQDARLYYSENHRKVFEDVNVN